jgi:integrase
MSQSDIRESGWPHGLYIRGNSYRFKRQVHGKRYSHVLGEINLKEALKLVDQFNFRLSQDEEPFEVLGKKNVLVSDFTYEWISGKKKRNTENKPIAKSSQQRYRAMVDNFLNFLYEVGFEAPFLSDVTEELAREFINFRMTPSNCLNQVRKGASQKTIHNENVVLTSIFKSAVQEGYLTRNPFINLKTSEPGIDAVRAKHGYITPKDTPLFLEELKCMDLKSKKGDASLYDIFYFMLLTGLRSGEACMQEWTDICFERKVMKIVIKQVQETREVSIPASVMGFVRNLMRDTSTEYLARTEGHLTQLSRRLPLKSKDDLKLVKKADVNLASRSLTFTKRFEWKPKGINGEVALGKTALSILRDIQRESKSNFVFAHHDGGSCRIDLQRALNSAISNIGIHRHYRVHDIRHTFAINLRKSGVGIETLKELLRHSSIKDTMVYARYFTEEGHKAVNKLEELYSSVGL